MRPPLMNNEHNEQSDFCTNRRFCKLITENSFFSFLTL